MATQVNASGINRQSSIAFDKRLRRFVNRLSWGLVNCATKCQFGVAGFAAIVCGILLERRNAIKDRRLDGLLRTGDDIVPDFIRHRLRSSRAARL
jgi:hypothetical protein